MEDTIFVIIMVVIMVAVVKFLVHISERKQTSTFTDPRDGKTYKTVTIGNQTWMAENLNYEAEGSKSLPNTQKYGRLYDWETAKKACPPGWHLPSKEEWQELVNYVGGDEVAGKNLKATSGWEDNGNGTDKYSFTALPGGHSSGSSNGISTVGYYGDWWTATEGNASTAHYWLMGSESAAVDHGNGVKTLLNSVRCVKD